jgi:hypothetical protein
MRELGPRRALGAGGAEQGIGIADATIRMPGLELHLDDLNALPLSRLGMQGGRLMSVVLGAELFARNVVVIDYAAGMMDVWEPGAFAWPKDGVELPLTFEDRHPYVEATLALPGRAPLTGRFVIDTGSSGALFLEAGTVERESVLAAFPRTLHASARGVGGDIGNVVGRGDHLDLGGLRLSGPIVVCPGSGAGYLSASGTIGNIGGEILRRFRVVFDYPHRRVLFQPNAALSERFEADMSGAAYLPAADRPGARVVRVDEGTPAAEAGLHEGDVVESVDGEPLERVGFAVFRDRLRQPGREVRFGVRRGEQSLSLALTLRRLI